MDKSTVIVSVARGNIGDYEYGHQLYSSTDIYSFLRDTGYDDMALEFDNLCPLCGVSFVMGRDNLKYGVHSFKTEKDYDGSVLCIHRCPKCKQLFVTRHIRVENKNALKQVGIWPEPIIQHDSYIDVLKDFSPRFYELYSAAVRLENLNMVDVVGNVYRMALECIVKDYAIYSNPDDADKIRDAMSLHAVIEKYFSGVPQIQKLAFAAKKLGNSYTHYVQKFGPADIANMKLFLNSVCAFISQELQIEKLQESAEAYIKAD